MTFFCCGYFLIVVVEPLSDAFRPGGLGSMFGSWPSHVPVEASRHSLEQAEKALAKRKVFAPASGTVEEVYFRPGEVVKEGQAVVAMLPPGNLKVRFFVAEPVRASLHVGQTIKVSCDGCQGDLTATISNDVDHRTAIALLKERLRQIPNVLATPEPDVDLLQFTPAGPVLCVRPYCNNLHYWQVYFDTNRMIRETFGAAGFPAPMPAYSISGARAFPPPG